MCSEELAQVELECGHKPSVDGCLDPVGYGYRPNVSPFADQVHNGPVILPPLNMGEFKLCSLSAG
jgi:hypothetical protein